MCSCLVPSDHSTLGYLINVIVYVPTSAERLCNFLLEGSPLPSPALKQIVERLKKEFTEAFPAEECSREQRDATLTVIRDRLRAEPNDEHGLFRLAAQMITNEAHLI